MPTTSKHTKPGFILWTADRYLIKEHIRETIIREKSVRKFASILSAKYDVLIDDMASDCYLYIEEHPYRKDCAGILEQYSGNLISNKKEENFARHAVKSTVLWWIEEQCRIQMVKRKRFAKYTEAAMLNAPLEVFEPDFTEENLFALLRAAKVTEKEFPLIFWVAGIGDDPTIQERLSCANKTLYNRWYKLRDRLVSTFYDPTKMVPEQKAITEETVTIEQILAYIAKSNNRSVAETIADIKAITSNQLTQE